jgi:hypothetical protein
MLAMFVVLTLLLLCVSVYAAEDDVEGDITNSVIKDGENLAGIYLPVFLSGPTAELMEDKWGFVTADTLITPSTGTTSFLTGKKDQLPGKDTGVSINIPMDKSIAGKKGITGVTQMLVLTSDMVSESIFNDMVLFLKSELKQPRNGTWVEEAGVLNYVPKNSAQAFFDRYGIAIMFEFSDGNVVDASSLFQFCIVYDEESFDKGSIVSFFGAPMFADSTPIEGNYWGDVTYSLFPDGDKTIWAFICDGKSDNKLDLLGK